MSKPFHKRKKSHRIWLWLELVVALLAAVALMLTMCRKDGEESSQEGFYKSATLVQTQPEQLADGLLLQGVGKYTGRFLEDGSDAWVTDVMMIQLKNTGKKDLQLADLALTYGDFSAEFHITNLPAGATMVVLEKNRQPFTDQRYLNMTLKNVAYFPQNMDAGGAFFEITGTPGTLTLKNISNRTVDGDIYVSYKYHSGDVLYGGITFRAKLPGGLKAGQTRQLSSEHFDPESCVVVQIHTIT